MYENEAEVALAAVREAAVLCQRVRERLEAGHAMEKSDRSPVTVADFGSQALICRRLAEVFPADVIVAEEDAADLARPEHNGLMGAVRAQVGLCGYTAGDDEIQDWINLGNGKVDDRYWTIDPIDGTKGFLRNDQYAVALALVVEGAVVVAALACPAYETEGGRGATFLAIKGEGVSSVSTSGERDRVEVTTERSPASWRFVESVESSHGNPDLQSSVARAVEIEAPSLRMDSQAKYAAVARGDAVLYLRLPPAEARGYAEKIWDHAAGSLIVEEAGGRVTDMHGAPLDFRSDERMRGNQGVVVSNTKIHDQVVGALAELAPSAV